MTVWIYIDTSKQVGDVDHVKAFATRDAAQAWRAQSGHQRRKRGGQFEGVGRQVWQALICGA